MIEHTEYKNPTTIRQNHLADFFFTHFYEKLVSILPDSNMHPQNCRYFFYITISYSGLGVLDTPIAHAALSHATNRKFLN